MKTRDSVQEHHVFCIKYVQQSEVSTISTTVFQVCRQAELQNWCLIWMLLDADDASLFHVGVEISANNAYQSRRDEIIYVFMTWWNFSGSPCQVVAFARASRCLPTQEKFFVPVHVYKCVSSFRAVVCIIHIYIY